MRGRTLRDSDEHGLVLGFLAGTAGLLTHAIGADSFIIVRIMEPFWFFAGIVTMLPMLQGPGGEPRLTPPPAPTSVGGHGGR